MKLPTIKKPSFKGWKVKSIISALAFVLMFFVFYQVSAFYDTYRVRFQTPIIFQAPVIVEARPVVLISPIPATESAQPLQKIEQSMAPEIKVQAKEPTIAYANLAKFIHYRESSYGQFNAGHHMYCRGIGKWNEIGYNPQNKFCFNSAIEGFAKLDSWLKERVPTMGVAGALCTYNGGKPLPDCQYYQEYLAWSTK